MGNTTKPSYQQYIDDSADLPNISCPNFKYDNLDDA